MQYLCAALTQSCAIRGHRGDVETFEVLAELKFDVPKIYKFHKDKSRDIMVDLIRLVKR